MADAAAKLAARIAELERRLVAMERGQQLRHSTVDVGGEALTVPDALTQGSDALAASVELDTRLTTAEGDLTTSKARLDAAEADIVDAFGQIDTVDGKADAADAKAVAAQTAASDAQTAADNAHTAADDAATAAADAAGIANGKGKALIQSTAPAAEDQNAVTLWIDTTGGANTPKRWNGSAWVAVTDKAATDAATAAANAASAAQAADDKAVAAQTAAGNAQSTADNALTMAGSKGKVYYSTAAPSGTGTAAGDLWRRIDASKNVIGEWYWTGSAWQSSQITTSAISNLDVGKLTAGAAAIQTLTAQKIAASTAAFQTVDVVNLFASSGTMDTAVIDKLWADVVNSRKITAGMLEAQMVLSNEIIAGNPAGNHAKLDSNGFRVMAPPNAGADPVEVIRLGTETDDYFGVVGADGNLTASITAEGGVSSKTVNVSDTLTLAGEDLGSRIDYMPQPLIAWGQVPIDTTAMSVASGQTIGLFEIGWDSDQPAGRDARMYLFNLNNVLIRSTAAGQMGLRLHLTTDGSTPTINTPPIQYSYGYVGVANGYASFNINRIIGSNNGNYLRVLVSLWNGTSGTASVLKDGNQTHLYTTVTDLGQTRPGTAIASTGGGSNAPAPVTTTKEWKTTGTRSYTGTGAFYNYNTAYMYSGLSPAGYGDLESVAIFPSLTSTLSGATINDIWIYVYYDFWYYGSGGNAAISLHGYSSLPASSPSLSFSMMSNGWPRAAGRWVRLPDSTYAGFKSGAWKGFGLGGHGGGYTEYGYAHDARIKIRYTK